MRTITLIATMVGVLCSAAPTKEIHKTLPLDAGGRVDLTTYKGTIHVWTWDRDEVDVSVRIEEDSASWFAQPVNRSDVRIAATRSYIRLESVSDSLPWVLSGTVPDFHYNIRIPKRASLRIKDYKSEADVDDLQAELEVETYKGSFRVREHSGPLRVQTYKGTVRADFRDFRGASSFDTYKGTIELGLPRESRFELRNDLQRKAALDSDFPGTRYDRAVNGGGPDLRLKSYKGRFRLTAR